MKKFSIIFLAALMFVLSAVSSLAFDVDWEEDFVGEIGKIVLPEGTPTIDGVINAGEGWSEAQYFDKTNTEGAWGGQTVDVSGNLYRAFDSEYFYIAAEISIPEYNICEGEDWIEGTDIGDLPGWDGDVFILSLDPLQALLYDGYNIDPAAWYCIGLFEGDVVRTYRTHYNDGEITDIVPANGTTTADGWLFEAAIPWTTICEDVEAVSLGGIKLTPEDILKEGNIVSGSMIYYDRRYDPEAEKRITHSRYVTVATMFPDGTLGIIGTPWTIQAHGIYFEIDAAEKLPEETDTDTSGQKDPTESNKTEDTVVKDTATNNTNGGNQSTNSGSSSTKKPASSSANVSNSTNTNAAQTYDIGIIAAVAALVVAAVGIVVLKKTKRTR